MMITHTRHARELESAGRVEAGPCCFSSIARARARSGVEPLSYLPNGWLSLFGKWLPLPAVMEARP